MRIQKGNIRFSKKDLWNLDKTLSVIIVQALNQFKCSDKHGVPPHLISDNVVYDMPDEYYEEQWNVLLDKMIGGFEETPYFYETDLYKDLYWCSLTDEEHFTEDELKGEYLEGFGVCHTVRYKLKDCFTEEDVVKQRELEKAYNIGVKKRVEEGREAFFKYYDNLWD